MERTNIKKKMYSMMFIFILISLIGLYGVYGSITDHEVISPLNNTGIGQTFAFYNVSSDSDGDMWLYDNVALSCGDGVLMTKNAILTGSTAQYTPLMYYEFENDLLDSGIWANHLTGTNTYLTGGHIGVSGDFDRESSHNAINSSFSNSTNLGEVRTIEFWVNHVANTLNGRMLCIGDGTNNDILDFYTTSGSNTLRLNYRHNASDTVLTTTSFVMGTTVWRQIVATFDNGRFIVYGDGNQTPLVNVTGGLLNDDFTELRIAEYCGGSTGFHFDGRIDGLLFLNETFTPQDVEDSYNSGNGLNYSATIDFFTYEYTYNETGLSDNTGYNRFISGNTSSSCGQEQVLQFGTCINAYYNATTNSCVLPTANSFKADLTAPNNNTLLFTPSLNFDFNINGTVDSCVLYFNDTLKSTLLSVGVGNNTFSNIGTDNDTTISWWVNCTPGTVRSQTFEFKTVYNIPTITGLDINNCNESIGAVMLLWLLFFVGFAVVFMGLILDLPFMAFMGAILWLAFSFLAFPCFGSWILVFSAFIFMFMIWIGFSAFK